MFQKGQWHRFLLSPWYWNFFISIALSAQTTGASTEVSVCAASLVDSYQTREIQVPVSITGINILDLATDFYTIDNAKNASILSTDEIFWVGNRSPNPKFFISRQLGALKNNSGEFYSGQQIFMLNSETLIGNFGSEKLDYRGQKILNEKVANGLGQVVIPWDDLDQRLIDNSLKYDPVIESRILRLVTNKGTYTSQVINGTLEKVSVLGIDKQIDVLLNEAEKSQEEPLYLILRHLHPWPDLYLPNEQQTLLAPYNNLDFEVGMAISKRYPDLPIIDGATVPNGYSYQVRIKGGRLFMGSNGDQK
jgi:hypothetical protein